MKKRIVLTVALMLIAVMAVSAAPTFSGRFRQGYTFKFAEGADPAITAWKTNEAKLTIKFADENGLWTVNLKGTGALDSNDKWSANASINLGKLIGAAGADLGDFGIVASIGANTKMSALSAYNDVTGNSQYTLKNAGATSAQLAMNYGKLVKFNVAGDPTNAGRSLVVSALVAPVDGVSVSAGYARNASYFNDKKTGKNVVGGAVNVDIAKLAGLDFKLGVSAFDNFMLKETNFTTNTFGANVNGGIKEVDGFVEFIMVNNMADGVATVNEYALNTKVNLNLVKNLGLDVYFNIADLTKVGDTFTVGGDASYKLSGVEFAMNMEYAKATKAFSVTPKVIIVF